jgi:GntR family transcriptional regulator
VEFRDRQPIYLQIADLLCERILTGTWKPGERIPSIRETAEASQVNPNTVTRTYAWLEERGIIRNQRGVGYFLLPDAHEVTQRFQRESFQRRELPRVFRLMDMLQVGFDELRRMYDAHETQRKENPR